MTSLIALIARLREIEGRATPGPWSVDPDDRPGMEYNNHVVAGRDERVCFMAHGGPSRQDELDASAALIAESRNALSALLDAAEALIPFAEIAQRLEWDKLPKDSMELDEHVIEAPADDIAKGAFYCLDVRAFVSALSAIRKLKG